jgi:hypothetical protein
MSEQPSEAKWTPDSNPIQQAARSIVCHYEGEAWKPPLDDFYARVDAVSRLIAAAPETAAQRDELLAACEALAYELNSTRQSGPVCWCQDGGGASHSSGCLGMCAAVAKART